MRTRWLLLGLVSTLSLGCQPRRAHPWDQGDAEAPAASPLNAAPTSLLPAARNAEEGSAAAGDPSADPASDDAGRAAPASDEDERAPAPPVRIGGPWVRCYGSFHAAGDPVKDVTRLALLCGPENGMRRLSRAPFEGAVAEGAPGSTSTFEAKRGECYRVFAVADATVSDLDVTVHSSRGAPVAADHGEDAWPVVQPDRPFCPLENDRYTLEIAAHRGHGRFAAEVWVLRTAKPRSGAAPRRDREPPDE
ncbi:MAG: hypothetical protein ABI134_31550 [Byssovorax sp.]